MMTRAPAVNRIPADFIRPFSDSLALSLTRAFLASADGMMSVASPAERLRHDPVALDIVTKSQVTIPTLPGTPAVAATQVHVLGALLGTDSMLPAVLPNATVAPFGQAASMFVPGYSRDGSAVGFSKAGSPFAPVQRDLSLGYTLTAGRRCGFISVFTREAMFSELFVRRQITGDIGAGIDTLMLSTNAADDATGTPAGLRNTVNAIGATAGGGEAAMTADLSAIGAAVAKVGGGNVLYVASPKEFIKIRARLPLFKLPLVASSGLADGVILCMAPVALAISSADRPLRIEVSDQAVLHMDTSPTALTTAGTPPASAFPERSMFQTDCKALKLVADDLDWGWRTIAGNCIAWVTGVTW
ncbi:hypothetical protein EI171_29105 [Bradyrhizobium sp. LCT2]|uniref:hypothetical protein n=1 Tax=Bradyrhizobium sp. LCT2 TaxID=2493093 RepID=UPI0013745AC0|nr:hypothetical protein [Bradyrhizobium sp. LCT2]QHP70994.1 hypothetical protein EI171_29105 [Bradyrhizobium sp. LCT2]